MKYEIEVDEIVERCITYTIEVESNDEGEGIADTLQDYASEANSQEDLLSAFESEGVKVIKKEVTVADTEYMVVE